MLHTILWLVAGGFGVWTLVGKPTFPALAWAIVIGAAAELIGGFAEKG